MRHKTLLMAGLLLALPARVQTFAVACGTAPASGDDVIGDIRTSYDNLAYGATPTKGDRIRKDCPSPSSIRAAIFSSAILFSSGAGRRRLRSGRHPDEEARKARSFWPSA